MKPLHLYSILFCMRQYFYFALVLVFIVACGKDKLETKPSIKIKSFSSNIIPNGGGLRVELEFADKEGDISNALFVQKIRTNVKVLPTIRDTFSLLMPEFTNNSRGTIEVNMDYSNHLVSAINPGIPPNVADDSLTIRFALRDLKGNVSDTVSIKNIIVIRN